MTIFYNHLLDVGFTVITTLEDYNDIPVQEIISALQKRIAEIHAFELQNPGSTIECFGFSDTFEMTEEETKCRASTFHY